MSEALLTVLQWCLLALIYLFFFRVLQATWHGALAPARRGGAATKSRRPKAERSRNAAPAAAAPAPVPRQRPVLMVIGPPEEAGMSFDLAAVSRIGRSAGCEITLDDTYVSQLHAQLSVTDDGVIIEDLGSTNGTYHNRLRLTAPALVRQGDLIQIGGTIMELR